MQGSLRAPVPGSSAPYAQGARNQGRGGRSPLAPSRICEGGRDPKPPPPLVINKEASSHMQKNERRGGLCGLGGGGGSLADSLPPAVGKGERRDRGGSPFSSLLAENQKGGTKEGRESLKGGGGPPAGPPAPIHCLFLKFFLF